MTSFVRLNLRRIGRNGCSRLAEQGISEEGSMTALPETYPQGNRPL